VIEKKESQGGEEVPEEQKLLGNEVGISRAAARGFSGSSTMGVNINFEGGRGGN